ncbi:MAG: flavocytochrome c, partial [Burkholderiales bacterium]|nr:flavocytochrome c [Burkholderiales bacterium]
MFYFRPLSIIIAIMLALSFVGAGCTADSPSERAVESSKSFESAYAGGAKGDYLAGVHTKKGINCVVCHGGGFAVDDNESAVNKSCARCHGTYEALGEASKKKSSDISAHDGHLVDPSCTSCHRGHEESFVYCNNCHLFTMDIPFGRQEKMAYTPENFSKYKKVKPNRVEKTDIVIVGAGGAGIVAAIEAVELGKKVILLEKMPIIGGSSLLSSGGINAADTKIQRENGIQDSADTFVKDTLAIGGGTNDEALVRILAEGSADAVDWLIDLGADLTINPKEIYAKTTVARLHFTKTGGVGRYLVGILNKKLKDTGVDVRLNSKAVLLNKDDKGRITGVLVHGKNTGFYEIQADATILTAGSYANNPELITRHHPELKGVVFSTQPGATGDALGLAGLVGAEKIGLDKVQIHPNIATGSSLMITLAMRMSGGILVNAEGKRFVDDNAPRNELGPQILKQTGQHAYLIYDDAVVAKRHATHEGYVRLNLVKEADSPMALAEKLGIPKEAFAQTMKTYAESYKNKKDAEFG